MSLDLYNALIDTAIFVLLLVWSYMDRHNIYLRKKDD